MANSVLKWCKTKFLNGYKPINGSSDSLARKDSLVGLPLQRPGHKDIYGEETASEGGSCNPGDSFPPRTSFDYSSHSFSNNKDDNDYSVNPNKKCNGSLNDSLEGGEEFAFTLYDFHGEGRVTKSDIRNLVRNIYKTVGSSTPLPSCGSRTVKVKVMVTDEDQNSINEETFLSKTSNAPKAAFPASSTRYQNENKDYMNGDDPRDITDNRELELNCSNYYSEANYNSNGKKEVIPHDRWYSSNDYGENYLTSAPTELIEAEIEESELEESMQQDQDKTPRKIYYRRQELLQIIEANMEKNNLYTPIVKRNSHAKLSSSRRRRKNHSTRQNNNCLCSQHEYGICESNCLDCSLQQDDSVNKQENMCNQYNIDGISDDGIYQNCADLHKDRSKTKLGPNKKFFITRHDSLRNDNRNALNHTAGLRSSFNMQKSTLNFNHDLPTINCNKSSKHNLKKSKIDQYTLNKTYENVDTLYYPKRDILQDIPCNNASNEKRQLELNEIDSSVHHYSDIPKRGSTDCSYSDFFEYEDTENHNSEIGHASRSQVISSDSEYIFEDDYSYKDTIPSTSAYR